MPLVWDGSLSRFCHPVAVIDRRPAIPWSASFERIPPAFPRRESPKFGQRLPQLLIPIPDNFADKAGLYHPLSGWAGGTSLPCDGADCEAADDSAEAGGLAGCGAAPLPGSCAEACVENTSASETNAMLRKVTSEALSRDACLAIRCIR